MILQFIIWFVCLYGLSYASSQSVIGEDFRKLFIFKKQNKLKTKITFLVNCIICSSFWWSILLTLVFSPSSIFIIPIYIQVILNGFIGMGIVKLIYTLIERIPNNFE